MKKFLLLMSILTITCSSFQFISVANAQKSPITLSTQNDNDRYNDCDGYYYHHRRHHHRYNDDSCPCWR